MAGGRCSVFGALCWFPADRLAEIPELHLPAGRWFIAMMAGSVAAILTQVAIVARRAIQMAHTGPRALVTSSPGVAVLLALDSVAGASTPQIATSLVMPAAMTKEWLEVLAAKSLVRTAPRLIWWSDQRWVITREGRRRLTVALDGEPPQP